jgi:oligosaccharide repeat unit polymerase
MAQLLIHPLFIWSMIWGIAIFLNNRYYSDLLSPFGMIFYTVIGSIFMGSLYMVIIQTFARNVFLSPFKSSIPEKEDTNVDKLQKYISTIFFTLLFGFTFEIIYCRWLPIVWYLLGMNTAELNYTEFGIKGLHGFLMSLYFFASSGLYLCYLKTRDHRFFVRYLLVLLIPVAFFSRQGLIVVLLQSVILYFLNRKIKLRSIFISIGIIIANIILFGIIGAYRIGTEFFMGLAQFSDKWPSWLPSGFSWVYIYITTPLSNLDNTFEHFQPKYSFYYSVLNILPTPIKTLLYPLDEITKGELVGHFNVSTYLVEAFQDFGLPGAIIYGFLVFALCYYIYLKAIQVRTIDYQLMYAVLGQCMVISIFYNHLTTLPILTQFLWIWIYRLYANKKALTHMPLISEMKYKSVLRNR